jgi:hypothetical protein
VHSLLVGYHMEKLSTSLCWKNMSFFRLGEKSRVAKFRGSQHMEDLGPKKVTVNTVSQKYPSVQSGGKKGALRKSLLVSYKHRESP